VSTSPRGDRASTAINVDIVRALWLAHNEGRIDDMAALMHPDATWRPWSRPGLAQYTGRDEIRRMLTDVAAVRGHYTGLIDDITEDELDVVTVRSRLVEREGSGATTALEVRIVLRDRLVYTVDTLAI
jgi:ketosteroid isomerase-like protein